MAVLIDNQQKMYPPKLRRIRKTAQIVLNALGCPDGELSILLVDDSRIADLNRQYLDRNGPTNVIAFPMRSGEFSELTPDLLGDVVISLDTTAREAEAMGIELEQRFRQLLVHGILHLFGYDHEANPDDERLMEKKNTELMTLIAQSELD